MNDIKNRLLNLFAPKAIAEVKTDLADIGITYSQLIKILGNKHPMISENRFRVQGDFFSDARATKVIVGLKSNPMHYSRIGFDLEVIRKRNDTFILRAEERVILGYLELNAVSIALEIKLNMLIKSVLDENA